MTTQRQTGSSLRAVLTGVVTATLGTFFQGLLEARGERRRLREGITLLNPPVRPKLVLRIRDVPDHVVQLCREALQRDFRIKRVKVDEPLQLKVSTRMSFWDGAQHIAIQGRDSGGGAAVLEISSVPWLGTGTVDGGVNYANVFLISKYVKAHVGAEAVIEENLIDLDVSA